MLFKNYNNQIVWTTEHFFQVLWSHSSCVSISLQIAEIEIVNWKYAQW